MNENAIVACLRAGPWQPPALAQRLHATVEEVTACLRALCAEGLVTGNDQHGYALTPAIEWLDAEAIATTLTPPVRAAIDQLQVEWCVDSTNARLLDAELVPQRVRVLLAERQSAGRGRRGRGWVSPPGANLYLSLLREFAADWAALAGLSLAVGVAAARALDDLALPGVTLKWPNDLQIDGRKLGGILIETRERHERLRVVIGIGLNVRMPQAAAEGIDQPWADVASLTDARVSRNALAAALLERMLPALAVFERDGLAPFLHDYAQRDALHGRALRVENDRGAQFGIGHGIAPDGALRLLTDEGERLIYAGEASVRVDAGTQRDSRE